MTKREVCEFKRLSPSRGGRTAPSSGSVTGQQSLRSAGATLPERLDRVSPLSWDSGKTRGALKGEAFSYIFLRCENLMTRQDEEDCLKSRIFSLFLLFFLLYRQIKSNEFLYPILFPIYFPFSVLSRFSSFSVRFFLSLLDLM